MSLNKEMIFGLLAFGGDNMTIVPNKNSLSLLRGNNTPYTFSTPIIIRGIYNTSFPDSSEEYTITYSDGSSITSETGELNLENIYLPEGTKFELQTKSSKKYPTIYRM